MEQQQQQQLEAKTTEGNLSLAPVAEIDQDKGLLFRIDVLMCSLHAKLQLKILQIKSKFAVGKQQKQVNSLWNKLWLLHASHLNLSQLSYLQNDMDDVGKDANRPLGNTKGVILVLLRLEMSLNFKRALPVHSQNQHLTNALAQRVYPLSIHQCLKESLLPINLSHDSGGAIRANPCALWNFSICAQAELVCSRALVLPPCPLF